MVNYSYNVYYMYLQGMAVKDINGRCDSIILNSTEVVSGSLCIDISAPDFMTNTSISYISNSPRVIDN